MGEHIQGISYHQYMLKINNIIILIFIYIFNIQTFGRTSNKLILSESHPRMEKKEEEKKVDIAVARATR